MCQLVMHAFVYELQVEMYLIRPARVAANISPAPVLDRVILLGSSTTPTALPFRIFFLYIMSHLTTLQITAVVCIVPYGIF